MEARVRPDLAQKIAASHQMRKVITHLERTAGWWAIQPGKPGISPPPVDKGGLLNAVPGTDPSDASLYNGDWPADLMGDALEDIDRAYRQSWGRAAEPEELKAVFEFVFGPIQKGWSWPKNEWIDEAVEILGVPMQSFMALPKESLEELEQAHRDYRNKAGCEDQDLTLRGEVPTDPCSRRLYQRFVDMLESTWRMSLQDAERLLKRAGSPPMSKCMECSKPPTHEAIWAEGRGRAWFCDKHWAEWSKEHKGDIDKHREVEDGQVGPKYGEKANKRASADDGKKTGDRTGVGFFIPVPEDLAGQFPPLGDEDKSKPHATFLYVGNVPKEQEEAFLKASQEAFSEIREPVRAHLHGPEYFVHPDKGRRVALMGLRYSHDMAGIRWKLRDKLIDAGIQVDDKFPLIYRPHVTLAYLDGLTAIFKGDVPRGDWEFDSIEVWGLPKLHTIPFGSATSNRVASIHLAEMTDQASRALMKFLSEAAKRFGVAKDTYVVGGAVRNFVIDQPIKDIDVVIDSIAAGRDSEWFAKKLQRAIPVQTNLTTNQYGVAILTIKGDWDVGGTNLNGEVIEIANARKESYGGEAGKGYKPHMVEPATIEEDVIRREFTFNTLMWRLLDLAKGPDKAEIIDITGCGLRDLQEGVARCPQPPDKTFSDDPTRMVRAIKFLLKYGLKIAPDVEASIKRNKQKLHNIPAGHLSNMIIGMFYEGGYGKKALLEMERLGLLDVVKDIARKDKAFVAALGNWAEKKADLVTLFDLMDLGMPTGKRLGFLDARQRQRVREITVQMGADEADAFVEILSKPGKVLDMKSIAAEFGLQGKEFQKLTEAAQLALLADPVLAANPHRLEKKVRQALGGGRTAGGKKSSLRVAARYFSAATFKLDIGDSVLYGKYKNKKGIIKDFKTDEKGDVVVVIEPYPKSRKQDKELKLFKIRQAPGPWPVEKEASPQRVILRHQERLAQHYPYQECLADGKKEGLNEEEARYRCQWIACCQSKRENKFKETGFCKDFDCDKKPKWKKKAIRTDPTKMPQYYEDFSELWRATNDFLDDMIRKGIPLDNYQVKKFFQRAWGGMIIAGRRLAEGVLDLKHIPEKKHKELELAARHFMAARRPPRNPEQWRVKTKRFADLLEETQRWEDKAEGSEEMFKLGPFMVHNTVGLTGKKLENIKKALTKAAKLIRASKAPATLKKVLYGDVFIVPQLQKGKVMAWYNPGRDDFYVRPFARFDIDVIHNIIHELSHRWWKKFGDKSAQREWLHHHTQVGMKMPEIRMPGVGDRLPIKMRKVKGPFIADGMDGQNYWFTVPIAGQDRHISVPIREIQRVLLKSARANKNYPTPYSSTDPEEHFCEASAMSAMKKLPAEHQVDFDRIWGSGGGGKTASTNVKYTELKLDDEEGKEIGSWIIPEDSVPLLISDAPLVENVADRFASRMASESDQWLKTLAQNGILAPPGVPVLDLSYRARSGDWYAKTKKGWFWWDPDKKKWAYLPMGPLHMAQRVAARYKNKKKVKTEDGDETTVYEYSEKQVQHRNREKAKRVEKLRGKLDDLQKKVKKDLKSEDLKTRLTALAVGLINDTFERVGNPDSAKDGHFGVTGWQAKHVTIAKNGDKATIKYIGKSGVSQEKETRDPDIIRVLKEAVEGKSGTDPVFEVDDVNVDSTTVNDYLKPMDITAKDIRGLHANRVMQEKLQAIRAKGDPAPDDKKEREKKFKEEFKKALEETAKEVGHEPSTLKSQYLVPGLEDTYLATGQVKKNLAKQAGWPEALAVLDRYSQEFKDIFQPRDHPNKTAIININNATDGDEDEGDIALRGFNGLISSLTLYERAIVQDMDIHDVPLLEEGGKFTLRGHEVDPDAVRELIGAGYLQEDGDVVRLSDMFEVKNRLYRSATKTHAEKEDEAIAELVKPAPKFKPPRKDLKNERVDLGDADTDEGTADKEKDLSLNYKKVAHQIGLRWIDRLAGKVPADRDPKKPGDYWQKDNGEWGVRLPDGDHTYAKDEESAAALAAGRAKPGEKDEEKGEKTEEGEKVTLSLAEKSKALSDAEKAKGEELTPEEKTQVEEETLVQKAQRLEEEAQRKKDEAEKKKLQADIDKIDNVARQVGDTGFAAELKGVENDEDKRAILMAYADELENLKKGVFSGDALSEKTINEATKALKKDTFGKGMNLRDSAKALAAKTLAKKIVSNPKVIGGTEVNDQPKDDAALRARTEQAFDEYSKMTPELRGAAIEQMAKLLEDETDENKSLELQHIANGLAMAALVNDEAISPIRDEPGDEMRSLVKALHKKGEAMKLVGMSTDEFHSPSGREMVRDVMEDLSENELFTLMGGDSGKYGKMIKAIRSKSSSDKEEDKATAKVLTDLLKDLHLDAMTSIHAFLNETAKNGENSQEEVIKKVEKAEKAIPNDDRLVKAQQELMDCLNEAAGDPEKAKKCHEIANKARVTQVEVAREKAKEIIGEPAPGAILDAQMRDTVEEGNSSNLEKKYKSQGKEAQSFTSRPKVFQCSFYTWGLISEGQVCARAETPRMETRRRNQTMAKKLTKKGAQAVTADLDKLATLFEHDYEILGVEQRIAHDFALRCDMLSDHLEKVALTGDDVVKEQGFDPDDIGRENSGPLVNEPDEPYMKGEFDQQENRELREKQQGGEIGPDRMTTEPQAPRPGVQAAFGDLAQALGSGGIPKEAAAQIEKALHLATRIVREAKKELPPEFLKNIEKKKEEAKDKDEKKAADEDEKKSQDEDEKEAKKASHGYNLTA